MTSIVLDTGVLGYLTNPKANKPPEAEQCTQWMLDKLSQGYAVYLPEIADYELRRGYLKRKKTKALKKLDDLGKSIDYLHITTAVMKKAANLWAESRNRGHVTAPPGALDGDMILIAQTLATNPALKKPIVVATTNVKHLDIFVTAKEWKNC